MHRENWEEVFKNQDKILKQLKTLDNKIFLAGGTGLQRFALSQAYRNSEDLDFFFPKLCGKKEMDSIKDNILKQMAKIAILENIKWIKDEKSWRMWFRFKENSEVIKLEILNFTCKRVKDLSFTSKNIFKTENLYNILLYKIKALCDRADTIKDLFDIYFILRVFPKLKISTLLNDVNIKFEKAIGIKYSKENIINSLKHNLAWDIEIDAKITHIYDLKLEIEWFQEALKEAFENREFLEFAYKSRISKKAQTFGITPDEYIEVLEENQFLANEWDSMKNYQIKYKT